MRSTQPKGLCQKLLKVSRVVNKTGSQIKTQRGESKRPYGVGLLVSGYDVSYI
jgi:20S proteasome alpha/beta subunit